MSERRARRGLTWTLMILAGASALAAEEPAVCTASRTQHVDALSTIGLDFSYEVSDAPSERIEVAGIGATWRYALTPDWHLDTGMRYRVRRDLDGRAESPSIFVSVLPVPGSPDPSIIHTNPGIRLPIPFTRSSAAMNSAIRGSSVSATSRPTLSCARCTAVNLSSPAHAQAYAPCMRCA